MAEVLERVQGRKFLLKQNSVEEMERVAREVPEKKFYNQVRVASVMGEYNAGDELNRAFPHIKPVKIEEFARKWWDGVQLEEPCWQEDQSFM